jgi:alkylhydroperoxidase family enzyme
VAVGGGDAATGELLSSVGDLAGMNIFRTLVRSPRAFKFVRYGYVLTNGSLPVRDRELIILRVAHRSQCTYEWGQHLIIAPQNGVDSEEIARVQLGPDQPDWSAFDAALLRAVDELIDSQRISDSTWDILSTHYNEQQVMEVPLLIGLYVATAYALNSFGVELDPDLA